MKSFRPRLVPASAVRGFDIRAMFAEAMLLQLTDPEAAEEIKSEALSCAEDLGYQEADSDVAVPSLLEGEPLLSEAWTDGFKQGRCPVFQTQTFSRTPNGWLICSFT